jgi:hypothetical protein
MLNFLLLFYIVYKFKSYFFNITYMLINDVLLLLHAPGLVKTIIIYNYIEENHLQSLSQFPKHTAYPCSQHLFPSSVILFALKL